MKGSSYDRDAHKKLTDDRAALPKESVFTAKKLDPRMDPKGLKLRECRDSTLYPETTGIMFFVDQTGSMGHIPEYLAKHGLPPFMGYIYDGGLVPGPQVLIGAIGDAECYNGREESPLQVGQFEGEAHLMDQWLTAIHLEEGGGGNGGESYDLAFYAAARHTAMDCHEKRGKKGYLFVSGDEPHLKSVKPNVIERRIGARIDGPISMKDIVAEAAEKFHCFFLIPDQERAGRCERAWRDLLGDNVIVQETHLDTAAVAAALIGLAEGTLASLDAVGEKLLALGCHREQVERVCRTVQPYASAIGRAGASRQTRGGTGAGRKRADKK